MPDDPSVVPYMVFMLKQVDLHLRIEVLLQLVNSQCIQALLYGLEARPSNKKELRWLTEESKDLRLKSVDFSVHRFL